MAFEYDDVFELVEHWVHLNNIAVVEHRVWGITRTKIDVDYHAFAVGVNALYS